MIFIILHIELFTKYFYMFDLQNAMRLVGVKLNTKVDDRGNGLYRIDVPLTYNDGTNRYQFVWARVSKNITRDGKDTLYFQSRVGVLNPNICLKTLLKEAYYGIYTMICIVDELNQENENEEMVYVQASPILDYSCNDDLIYDCVMECATVADYLEKKYWGVDIH